MMNPRQPQILIFTIVFCLVCTIDFLHAQSSTSDDEEVKIQPGQVTLVTPIGTNGNESVNIINHVSFNLLIGSSAGVKGAEFGGLINRTYGSITGAQFAGLANYQNEPGLINGGQFSGIINKTNASVQGVQSAGLININENTDSLSNPGSYFQGVQISGIINSNATPMEGAQLAGIINKQAQFIQGVQIAGIANISPRIQGAQIAGIVNKTKTLSGVQIGLINIADTVEKGVQIGLINIAKKGYRYHVTELESNESFYANVNYKMGVKRFYSIFSLAFSGKHGKPVWAPGFGFGTYIPVGQKTGLNIDAISYQVNEDEWWTDGLNQLNKLKINGSYQIAHVLTLYGGFSLNVLVSDQEDAEGNLKGSILNPEKAFYDEVEDDNRIIIYPGINIGIRF